MTETRDSFLQTAVNGESVIADASGVLVVPSQGALIVSDLHFEKGSAFAARGQMLPPYDTRATLRRLREAIAFFDPDVVIALGDSFHDLGADRRMDESDALSLKALVKRVRRWVWIEGNHDPAPPPQFGGEVRETLELGRLTLRHEPVEGPAAGEVAGHLHPCAKISSRGRSVRKRCFATDGHRLIMPAFGAFTGGLNVCDPAFRRCFGDVPDVLAMGQDRVFAVSRSKCVPDRRRLSYPA